MCKTKTADLCGNGWCFTAWLVLMSVSLSPMVHGAESDTSASQRRNQLVETVENRGAEAVPVLIEALRDDRDTVRRTAAHLLVDLGAAARPGFEAALRNPHAEVRRIIIRGLAEKNLVNDYWLSILLDEAPVIHRYTQLVLMQEHPQPKGERMERLVDRLEDVYREADASRRRHVVGILAAFDRMTPASRRLLALAARDEQVEIRLAAYRLILERIERDWREAADLLEAALSDPSERVRDVGRQIRWKLLEVAQVRMPRQGWRFRIDPDDVGRDEGWYAPDWDDSRWRDDVPIETSWKKHLSEVYNGVGWYRRTIQVPDVSGWDRAYLHFEGVDEQAWVWLNGESVGEHTLGMEGWNVPFTLDVTDAVEPGAANQITVRARNTTGGAGIWRPVRLRFLDEDALRQP